MLRFFGLSALVLLAAGVTLADEPRALFRAAFDGALDGRGPAGEVVASRPPGELSPARWGTRARGVRSSCPARSVRRSSAATDSGRLSGRRPPPPG